MNTKKNLVALTVAAAILVTGTESSFAGADGGSRFNRDRVLAHSSDTYTMRFRAGEVARVAVTGDGDTDLDLYVYDEFGNLIGSDTDYTDQCIVTWAPRWTGVFTIQVVNRGNVYNVYRLQTN